MHARWPTRLPRILGGVDFNRAVAQTCATFRDSHKALTHILVAYPSPRVPRPHIHSAAKKTSDDEVLRSTVQCPSHAVVSFESRSSSCTLPPAPAAEEPALSVHAGSNLKLTVTCGRDRASPKKYSPKPLSMRECYIRKHRKFRCLARNWPAP